MIVDKSAILSILNLDDESLLFATALEQSEKTYISAINYFEIAAFIEKKHGDRGMRELDIFFKKAAIKIYPVDENIVDIAKDCYRFYGKSKARENGLGLSDCFAYATAKHLAMPLLFKGDIFNLTDIEKSALPSLPNRGIKQ